MDKIEITEENRIALCEEWAKEAKEVSPETLQSFINHVMNDYKHTYDSIVRAISVCSYATACSCNKMEQGGITGWQASNVMWEFIRLWSKPNNKCGLRLIDMDDMLYPQYEDRFDKTLSKFNYESLVKEAKARIKEDDESTNSMKAHWKVRRHWEFIANGGIPFGYRLRSDNE